MPTTDSEGVMERMMMPKDACILILPSVNMQPDMAGNAAAEGWEGNPGEFPVITWSHEEEGKPQLKVQPQVGWP